MKAQKVNFGRYLESGKLKFWMAALICALSLVVTAAAEIAFKVMFANNTAVGSFMYDTLYGSIYIYNFAFLLVLCVFTFINVKWMMFRDMMENRWYYLLRMGYSSVRIASSRLASSIVRPLLTYLTGAAVTAGIGLIAGQKFYLNGFISLVLFGICVMMLFVMFVTGFGAVCRRAAGARIAVAAYMLGIGAFVWYAKLHVVSSRKVASLAVADQMRLSGTSFITFAAVLAIVFIIMYFLSARDKSAFYHPSEPKAILLQKMGLKSNIKVRDGDKIIAEGAGHASKKEQKKQKTMQLTLESAKAENVDPRGRKPKAKPEQKPKEKQKVEKPPKKRSGGRIAISIVLAALLVLAAAAVYTVNSINAESSVSVAGYSFMVAKKDTSFVKSGQIMVFKESVNPATGDYVLYKAGRAYGVGKVASIVNGRYTMEDGTVAAVVEIIGILEDTNGTLNTLHGYLSGTVGLAAAAALALAAVAIVMFGAILRPRRKKEAVAV